MTGSQPEAPREPANDNGSDAAPETPLRGRCPICGKPPKLATKPFCSKRCADVDLHRWLGGAYRLPVTEDNGLPDEDGSDH